MSRVRTGLDNPPASLNIGLKRAWEGRRRNIEMKRDIFHYALASGLRRKQAAMIAGISYETAGRYHRQMGIKK